MPFVIPHKRRRVGSAPITDGLVSWWGFDEGSGLIVGDSVGGHDGAMIGMDAGNWEVGPGGVGYALAFNSNTQYVSVPTHTDFDNPAVSPDGTTVFVYFYVVGAGGSDTSGIISRYRNNWKSPWSLVYGITWNPKKIMACGYDWNEVKSAGDYEYGGWHRMAATFQDNAATLCIDGAMDNTDTTGNYVIGGTPNNITFGKVHADTDTYALNGKIAEARYYNRKLSDAELIAITSGNG